MYFRPELVNMRQVASNTSQENLELAFATAEKELGVTRLLDPEGEETKCLFSLKVNWLIICVAAQLFSFVF